MILDEADRMLDMGFGPTVDRLSTECRWRKQTLLFSSTLEGRGEKGFTADLFKDPAHVDAEPPCRERKKISPWYHRADDVPHKVELLKRS